MLKMEPIIKVEMVAMTVLHSVQKSAAVQNIW